MRTDQPETYIPTDTLTRGTRVTVGEFLVYRDLRTVDDTALYDNGLVHSYSLLDASSSVIPLPAWRYKSDPDAICFAPVRQTPGHPVADAVALIPLRDEQLHVRLAPNGFEVTWPSGFAWYLVPTAVLVQSERHDTAHAEGTSVRRLRHDDLTPFEIYDEAPLTRSRLLSLLSDGPGVVPTPTRGERLVTSRRVL